MTTDSGRSARSREHILVAVAALLQEQGASAITFQNVAEAAGVGRATMYRHWTDPAALMRDALGHGFQWHLKAGLRQTHSCMPMSVTCASPTVPMKSITWSWAGTNWDGIDRMADDGQFAGLDGPTLQAWFAREAPEAGSFAGNSQVPGWAVQSRLPR